MQKVLNKYDLAQSGQQHKLQASKRVKSQPKIRIVPAVMAIGIQCAALLTLGFITWLSNRYLSVYFGINIGISVFNLVLLQALLAASFSYLVGMASWWRWIHLGFPLTAWAMFQWQIPNEIYLVGFIISLSLFWTTFRTQVPFFPSRPVVWQQVAKIIPQNKPVRLIDIGSGLGDMSMYMAKIRPDSQIEGIEIAPLPWLISYVRAKFRRSQALFKLGDYTALDFANYDVIFAYLSPAAMVSLWEKASQEMQSGSLLISLEFEIPNIVPSLRIAATKNSPAIFVWKIN